MSFINKIFERISSQEKNGNPKPKKRMENILIIFIAGVIIFIAGTSLTGGKKEEKEPKEEPSSQASAKYEKNDLAIIQEEKIKSILSQIQGAGNVDLMITYVSGNELVPAVDTKKSQNETFEKDQGGGTRDQKQSDQENKIVYGEEQGVKKPIIVKELLPEVKGVVVVADGAGDQQVRENLCKAVQVLVNVPVHKIQVFGRGEK